VDGVTCRDGMATTINGIAARGNSCAVCVGRELLHKS
jgi:hypothetical protein